MIQNIFDTHFHLGDDDCMQRFIDDGKALGVDWFMEAVAKPGKMAEMLDRLRSACERGNMASIVEHDIAFHRSLVNRTGSTDLEAIWLPITVRMRWKYSRHKNLIEVHEEHARIVDHIHRRNLKSAVKMLGKHIV